MHRHLQPEAPVVHRLSVEEEAILVDEYKQQETELTETMADVERLGDITVTVGDVETVISNTPEVGTIEQSLIGSIAEMAVAGTDSDPEDVISITPTEGVSAESVVNTIKDNLAKLWEAIKKAVAKLWAQITAFFSRIKGYVTKVEKKAEEVKEAVAESGHISGNKSFTFKGKTTYLRVDGRIPTSGMDQHLKHLTDTIDTLLEKSKHTLDQIADLLEKTIDGIRPDSSAADFDAYQKDFVELVEELGKGIGEFDPHGSPVGYYTKPLMGQSAVSLKMAAAFSAKGADISDRYAAAVQSSVTSAGDNDDSETEVPGVSDEESDRITAHALKWCSELPKHKAYDLTGLHDKMNRIEKKVDTARARFASSSASPEAYKFLNGFARAFPFVDKMSVNILGKVMTQVLMVNYEVLEYCGQSALAKAKTA